MSGKMQEKETEISSLFEKKSAILSMTSFAIEVSSLFQCIKDHYFSYPLQVAMTPVLIASILLVLSRPDFFPNATAVIQI